MKLLRSYIRNLILKEFRRPFRQSEDYNWPHGSVVFHFEKPDEDELYGDAQGNIHGFRSHAVKHFDEFVPKTKRNEIVEYIKQAIKANGYTTVWQQRRPTTNNPNPPVTEISVDRLTRKHILNKLDFLQDKFISRQSMIPIEKHMLNYVKEIHRIYLEASNRLENEPAVDVSDKNFPSREDLFEKLKQIYLDKGNVEFVIHRFGNKYLVKLNLADFRYKSIENWTSEPHEQKQGTLMVLDENQNRQTFRRALTIWAPMRNNVKNLNQMPPEYSNFSSLCQEANDGNPEWGEWNIYNKRDGAP